MALEYVETLIVFLLFLLIFTENSLSQRTSFMESKEEILDTPVDKGLISELYSYKYVHVSTYINENDVLYAKYTLKMPK